MKGLIYLLIISLLLSSCGDSSKTLPSPSIGSDLSVGDYVFVSSSGRRADKREVISISSIEYDKYGQDCGSGVSINIASASNSQDKVGKGAFIKPANEKYRMPEGLIASGQNKLRFFGRFESEKCIHLMGDGVNPEPELFFIYDSVHVSCPYKFFNIGEMEFDTQTCGRHESFNERITVIE